MFLTRRLVTINLPDERSPFFQESVISLEGWSLRMPTPPQVPAWMELLRKSTGAPKCALTWRCSCRPSPDKVAATVRWSTVVRWVSEKHQMPLPSCRAILSLPRRPQAFEHPILTQEEARGGIEEASPPHHRSCPLDQDCQLLQSEKQKKLKEHHRKMKHLMKQKSNVTWSHHGKVEAHHPTPKAWRAIGTQSATCWFHACQLWHADNVAALVIHSATSWPAWPQICQTVRSTCAPMYWKGHWT